VLVHSLSKVNLWLVHSQGKVVFMYYQAIVNSRLYFGLKMRLFFYRKRRYLIKCALYVSDITFIGYGEEKQKSDVQIIYYGLVIHKDYFALVHSLSKVNLWLVHSQGKVVFMYYQAIVNYLDI
jgi:hypothetical protein